MIPAWLDLRARIPTPERSKSADKTGFVLEQYAALRLLTVPRWQRCQLIGCAYVESDRGTNRGSKVRNPVGVKAKQDIAHWYARKMDGAPLAWFSEEGHTDKGDPKTVYYAAFPSLEIFWTLWLARFVGTDKDTAPYAKIYSEAGPLFWAGSAQWLVELLRAGYAGDKVSEALARSVKSRRSGIATVERIIERSERTP